MKKPNFRFENKLWGKEYLVIGIDEVGRGALAGPLVVGAVVFLPNNKKEILKLSINDSKKISSKKRKKLAELIKKKCFVWGISSVSARIINNHNINKAFQKGVKEVVKKLRDKINKKKNQKINSPISKILNFYLLIDGFYVKYLKGVGLKKQIAIIKGDQKSISIAAASIIAKVFRDKLMEKLSKKYPKYHWNQNKGYGTKDHIEALKKYGKTKYHRELFLRKIIN